ncbi:MAG: mandelate racemase/muconate lactonizing enzyme family protein, partial [Planctomycetaceae bacterium]
MKIVDIRVAGLRGATPAGGWSQELVPGDCVHTLVVVHTDAGLSGVGSVFTGEALVRAAVEIMEPLWRG